MRGVLCSVTPCGGDEGEVVMREVGVRLHLSQDARNVTLPLLLEHYQDLIGREVTQQMLYLLIIKSIA
eukprot:CAMPEP_0182432000 /NCGR_PEP_ID=MMETSP1167-20130531/53258_1 /TAXON_ID=2988 /ORGANISM="Mallomonas Sp, Strain CCMP3275" /LENGTH=67 /DNA_ID=CAMNT_0024618999 /DNA_START=303 /DNA_END=506 /DNA_ORIENTATION=-